MENKDVCNHKIYQCKKCNSTGCKENDCLNQLILDCWNPYNKNFEHGDDLCIKCNIEGAFNFESI